MYYKISSLVLNSGKNLNHSGDVYISQPNPELENLAGNFFVIAEMPDKRSETQKIVDFLASKLEEYYYGDEKIGLADRIEGLKLASVFEAALARINHDFVDFLNGENIKLSPEETSFTIGLVCRNKLHFSIFGKNRAFLIYLKNGSHDILNVESNARDADEEEIVEDRKAYKVFSSVINGEIPDGAYFVFSNEALPEYISAQDMMNMVVKLPPVVACEQMKNVLSSINSFIPFLGIIIKNVSNSNEAFISDDLRASDQLTAHESISHLNYTEKRTEKMLSPAGLIDLKKLASKMKGFKLRLPAMNIRSKKRQLAWRERSGQLEGGEIRKNSFVLKDTITLKKKTAKEWGADVRRYSLAFISIFSLHTWKHIWEGAKSWYASLTRQNRLILKFLSLVLVFLVASIMVTSVTNKYKAQNKQFSDMAQMIEDRSASIDSYLLYNNRQAAKQDWLEVSAALASLPQNRKSQQEEYQKLQASAEALHDKAYGISRVSVSEKFWPSTDGRSFAGGVFFGGKALLADPESKTMRTISLSDAGTSDINIEQDFSQADPSIFADESNIFILSQSGLIKISDGSASLINLPLQSDLGKIGAWNIFSKNIYLADTTENQVYKYSLSSPARIAWLKDSANLSDVISMHIDSDIYLLHADGQIEDFRIGKRQNISFDALEGNISASSFLLGAPGGNIAMCDPKGRSLAIWGKDGKLKKQYVFEGISQIVSIGLGDDGKNAYLFDGIDIYSASLE